MALILARTHEPVAIVAATMLIEQKGGREVSLVKNRQAFRPGRQGDSQAHLVLHHCADLCVEQFVAGRIHQANPHALGVNCPGGSDCCNIFRLADWLGCLGPTKPRH